MKCAKKSLSKKSPKDWLPSCIFFSDARINKQGYEAIDAVMKNNLRPLSVDAVELDLQNGSLVLDTRNPEDFEKGLFPARLISD